MILLGFVVIICGIGLIILGKRLENKPWIGFGTGYFVVGIITAVTSSIIALIILSLITLFFIVLFFYQHRELLEWQKPKQVNKERVGETKRIWAVKVIILIQVLSI